MKVRLQLPAPPLRVTLQLVAPSETATVPVGLPSRLVTPTETLTGCPTTDGDGVMPVMLVVEPISVTVWPAVPDEVRKSASPV